MFEKDCSVACALIEKISFKGTDERKRLRGNQKNSKRQRERERGRDEEEEEEEEDFAESG